MTHHSATLINNIYVSDSLHRSFESTIIINDMSDHLPILTMLKQTKLWDSEPITFNSRCFDDKKLKQVNADLMKVDWIGVLNGSGKRSQNLGQKEIYRTMDDPQTRTIIVQKNETL